MATNLKIDGNFIVLSDTDTTSEFYRQPRSSTTFLYEKSDDGLIDYFIFDSLNNVRRNSERLEFTDIIDNRTGAAFSSVADLQEFLSVNLGGNNNPVLVLRDTGWASYIDGTYTSGSPFAVSASTDTILPNDANTVVDSQKPEDVDTFYTEGKLNFTSLSGTFTQGETITGATSGASAVVQFQDVSHLLLRVINGTFTDTETITGATSGATATVNGTISNPYITGRNGDNLDIMLYFKAVPSTVNQWIDIWIDIDGAVGELYRQTFDFPRGSGVERGVLYALPSAYTLNTWEANGGIIYVRSNATLDIYNINFNFDRSHKAN